MISHPVTRAGLPCPDVNPPQLRKVLDLAAGKPVAYVISDPDMSPQVTTPVSAWCDQPRPSRTARHEQEIDVNPNQRIGHSPGAPAGLDAADRTGDPAAGTGMQRAGHCRAARHHARRLAVASRQLCLGAAITLAAPLLTGTTNARAAATPARYPPAVKGSHTVAPDTALAASPASYPRGAAKTDSMPVSDRIPPEMISSRAHGHDASAQLTTQTATVVRRPTPAALAPMAVPRPGVMTPLDTISTTRSTPTPSPALGTRHYPHAFIEWKLSARSSRRHAPAQPPASSSRHYPHPFTKWKLSARPHRSPDSKPDHEASSLLMQGTRL